MSLDGRSWVLVLLGGLVAVLSFGTTVWLVTRAQMRVQNEERTREAARSARLVRELLEDEWPEVAPDTAAAVRRALAPFQGRVVVLGPGDGVALSGAEPGDANDLLQSREVERALLAGAWTGTHTTRDGTAQVVAAVRIGSDQEQLGVVWVSRPAWQFIGDRGGLARALAVVLLLAGLTTFAFSVVLYRVRRRALYQILRVARNLSAGDISAQLEIGGDDDLALLASSLNALRRRLAAQLETIDRQRKMLASLVNQLRDGVVVIRRNGRVVLINPEAARLLNLELGSSGCAGLVGRTVEEAIPYHVLQRLLLEPPPEESQTADSPVGAFVQDRLEIRGAAGTRHLLARAFPLTLARDEQVTGSDGRGRVLVLTDITQLQRTIQMRTDFVANASHELRTPLSTIRAAVEALTTMAPDERGAATATEFLQAIDRHSTRLERMVSELLELSRLETPQNRFETEPVGVVAVVEEVRSRFAEVMERKGQHWLVHVDDDVGETLEVSPHLLRLVLDNLVENAVKFTEPGKELHLRVRRDNGYIVFDVIDQGCGIPQEEQGRVFERFYQVERGRSGAERGTGLGLSIVRHAVGAMRGTIRLESTVGRGTRVSVAVPEQVPAP